MTLVRLLYPLRFDHFELLPGTIIGLPKDIAMIAVTRGIAESAEPMTAVIEPQEFRRRGRPASSTRMAR